MKSVSDDDLCSTCRHCTYVPAADRHACTFAFPGVTDEDDYIVHCSDYAEPDPVGEA